MSSLSVCISLLDPKRSFPSPPFYSFRGHHVYESPVQVNQETVGAMLPQLSEFYAYDFHFFMLYKIIVLIIDTQCVS